MNKTYTMNNDVRNSFKRILKDVSFSSNLSWTEQSDDTHTHFTINGSQNVIDLVDKFNAKLCMVNLMVRTKSKFYKDLEEITHSFNGRIAKGTKKGYFIITLDRSTQNDFRTRVEQHGMEVNISQSLI